MRGRLGASLLLAASLLACGAPAVQRAALSPPSRSANARAALGFADDSGAAAGEVATSDVDRDGDRAGGVAPAEDAPRFLVTPKSARLELVAQTPIGAQTFSFRRYAAHASGVDLPVFHARIETDSLEGGAVGLASFVKSDLLEVTAYPTATFDGVVQRGTDAHCTVVGTLSLHGVTRTLRFEAMLYEEGDSMRLVSTFDIARKSFAIAARGPLETFIPDDVRVVIDVVARREHVTAQEIE